MNKIYVYIVNVYVPQEVGWCNIAAFDTYENAYKFLVKRLKEAEEFGEPDPRVYISQMEILGDEHPTE